MKLLRSTEKIPEFSKGTVVTIGNFDGVHLGHQALLSQLKTESLKRQLPLVVVLFEPQPNEFFLKDKAPARLSTLREKIKAFASCGVDYVVCLRFNQTLAHMPAQQFAETYFFFRLHCRYLLIGNDFQFGYQRQGNITLLRAIAESNNCLIEIFSDILINNRRISSTKVREALFHGELEEARKLLGRSYSMSGRVVRGNGQGRQWGIPTANLALSKRILPLKGVYCVEVQRENGACFNGVANVGCRPTLDGSKNVLEVHLFDCNDSLYQERLQINFLHKLRDEQKFDSKEQLIKQIYQDVTEAKAYFSARSVTCSLS